VGAHLAGAHLQGAYFSGAHLDNAYFSGAILRGAQLKEACLQGADLRGAKLENTDLSKVKSLYWARCDPSILSEIKAHWPEKLATIWDDTKKDWIINDTLLEQVKKPDWHGWPEEEKR
jgi:hypothetical protein